MKYPLHVRKHFHLSAFLISLFLGLSIFSFAQPTLVGVSSSPADNASQTTSPITLIPPAGMQAGDLVVIYSEYKLNSGTLSINPLATGGQTWTSETQANNGNQRIRIYWCRFNGTWTGNPGVQRSGAVADALTAVMYVFRPSSSSNTWVKQMGPNNANNNSNNTLTIGGITTTMPSTVTMGFWGTEDNVTWGSLTGAGWSNAGLSAQYRNSGGTRQSQTAAYNINNTIGTLNNVSQTRSGAASLNTIMSIISWAETVPNDASTAAVTLTPSSTCTNTSGNLYAASFSAATPTIGNTSCVSGTVFGDLWYTFTAPTDVVSISLNGAGSDVTGVELLTGTTGSMYSIACGGSSGIPVASVVAGTTYYVRVYSNAGVSSTANSAFNICVTAAPPPNDDCSGAINLNVSANCSKVFGTISMATLSTGFGTTGTCTGSGSATYDVWYKFTATSSNPTITLGDFGGAFPATRRAELYTGTCGSLTPLNQCGAPSISAVGLTVGNTYYVRVYNTVASIIGDGKFSICITSGATSNVRIGNSYVNVTKNTTGGVVEPGDILEIRMTIWVGSSPNTTLYNARYVDNVPTKTAMQTGSEIRIVTNEGLRYRGYTATDGSNDDAATYKSSLAANEYNVRLNLGTTGTLPGAPADNTPTNLAGANSLVSTGTSVPRAGGGLLFATSFRVQVTGTYGDTIKLNGGKFLYRTATTSTSDSVQSGIPYKILITQPLSLCANSVGINSALEYGGTFGAGNTLNRGTDLFNPIAGYQFVSENSAQAISDGQYGIVNNTSPRGGINQNASRANVCPSVAPDLLCANRMFGGHWYINGDHSGSTSATSNNPVSPGNAGGYMLAVNADYVASEAYRQTLNNLCPNTYYEFSAWFKNICYTCGADSTGAQWTGSPTAPTAGYPGVLPNLTFAMDGLDRYSTGEISPGAKAISGDQNGWVKKGFVFLNDTSHSVVLSIRNNAQGGGGNDWVMDDIAIATCVPTMVYSPTITPTTCIGNPLQINDTVRSYYNNYTYYRWQRSVNGGSNWSDITPTTNSSLNFNGSFYQFITSYTIPAIQTTLADSGDLYRVIVATSDPNLANTSCLSTDASTIITLNVLDCGSPLAIDFISFSGKLNHGNADLIWTTSKENEPVSYFVERSYNGTNFTSIGMSPGNNNSNAVNNTYKFADFNVQGKIWYRITMVTKDGQKKYSRIITLDDRTLKFGLTSVINPFSTKLDFEIAASENSRIDATLINMSGKPVRKESFNVYEGTNNLSIINTEILPAGIYILQIQNKEQVINKKVMKK